MAEKTQKYKVKPGRFVNHGGEIFPEGNVLELVEAVYQVHKDNLELIPEPLPTKPETKADAQAS